MSSKIYVVIAREILDSRGNPTIEVTCVLESGYRGVASVPAGASKGTYEAVELRDGDKERYNGMGVLKAVGNVNNEINSKIRGLDALDQAQVDKTMVSLDGTPNKSRLGANATLGVSHAIAAAAAAHQRQPLYLYLNSLFGKYFPVKIERIPTPTFNIINGGMHGAGNLDFQEFHMVPASNKAFHEALEIGVMVYYAAKKILIYRNAVHSVGDEGGFAPNLYTNLDAFEVLVEAIKNTKYRFGFDAYLGLDTAASYFLKDRGYQIKDRPLPYSRDEFIGYYKELHEKYRLLLLEDALDEDDWDGWKKMTANLGADVLVVGDDHLATNLSRLERAIKEKSCSAILAKPNQIGSLSEFLAVCALAKKNDIKIIASHRSGETTDTFISDLAVAIQSDYVKFGAPARGERVVKYNRLLAIESELEARKKINQK
jgi:enolase